MSSKIVKGDKFVLKASEAKGIDLTAGRVYTAVDVVDGEVKFRDDVSDVRYRDADRVVKVLPDEKIKAGDKVAVTIGGGSNSFKAGDVLTVDSVTGEVYPSIRIGGRWWDGSRFVKVATDAPKPVLSLKVGDRVQVAENGVTQGYRGAIGVVARVDEFPQTFRGRESAGYYVIETDAGRKVTIWDFDLKPYAPTFKTGDRVERTGKAHFIQGYSGHDYGNSECKPGETGEVTGTAYFDGAYRVKWDSDRTSVISAKCLKATTKAKAEPKAAPKFKVGDRVTMNAKGYRHVGKGGTITKVWPSTGSIDVAYYDVDVDGYGPDHGGIWQRFLDAETFKFGDKVIATSVLNFTQYEGRPATIEGTHGPVSDNRYYVKFADGKTLYAQVKAYDPKAVHFRDLDDAEKAAQVRAGKIAKLKALAAELEFDVFPVKAAA